MSELLLLTNDNYLIRILQTELKPFDMILRVENLFSDGIKYMRNNHFKSVIIKLPLNTESCPRKIIKTIKSVNPFVPVYFLMDYVDHRDIITLIKEGAENVFIKPYNFTLLGQELQETISRINSNNKSIVVPENENAHHYMRANSKAAEGLYAQIDKVADTNFTVIIYGETGTGKESVARQLCQGKYKDKPFVAVDCGCLNKELAGSELFGHKKGSFTNAISDKTGAFEEANHGTLFLDEIGNLDYNVQVQLLRAIEEKKIKKIGSHEEKEVNVRIIVASNEKLLNAVKEGRFREDLYYRLNEFEINIPPLRKRKDDIEAFIKHFISVTNRKLNKNVLGVEDELMALLIHYDWPGNIRELKNIIKRGCLMADHFIDKQCMTSEFLSQLSMTNSKNIFSLKSDKNPIKNKVVKMEYDHIMDVLVEENFNKTMAANRLNMNRKTLYNKLKNYEMLLKSYSSSM